MTTIPFYLYLALCGIGSATIAAVLLGLAIYCTHRGRNQIDPTKIDLLDYDLGGMLDAGQ